MIKKIWGWFAGKKTYLVSLVAFGYGAGIAEGYWMHSVPIDLILGSLALGALRAGIASLDRGANGGNQGVFPGGNQPGQ